MMECICKQNLALIESIFKVGSAYQYHYINHSETGMKIYFVKEHNSENTIPMVEKRFRKFFEDIQEKREEKINKILK